jgi:hypothetical protein
MAKITSAAASAGRKPIRLSQPRQPIVAAVAPPAKALSARPTGMNVPQSASAVA